MDKGEKLIVLKNVVGQYAQTQFALNGITQAEACIVVSNVLSDFQAQALNNILMSNVSFNNETEENHEETPEVEDGNTK